MFIEIIIFKCSLMKKKEIIYVARHIKNVDFKTKQIPHVQLGFLYEFCLTVCHNIKTIHKCIIYSDERKK